MSTEADNLRRAIDDAKFAIRQLWQRIDTEPDAAVRADMKRAWRENDVPQLKSMIEELERMSDA